MYCLQGENPTKMYLQSIKDLMANGDEVSPRGKLVKELRPACIEFLNPYSRVTFLGGRRINPFFQVAESLWILSGKADVEWLTKFNANMSMFSDDGKWFNAPYGERIRTWNKNALHNVVINPIDQLADAYRKLVNDKDTRQAVIVISNPMFDNSKYTIDEKGKDIACLTGDTIIASPEGDITIKELVDKVQKGEEYPVFSYNLQTKTVEIKPVSDGALTRKKATILEITMGDGTIIKATPDHKMYRKAYDTQMMISDKGYKYPVTRFLGYELIDACDLKVGDRLGYLLRFNDGETNHINVNLHDLSKSVKKSSKVHRMYKEYLIGRSLLDEEVIHHINGDPTDNRASNLEILKKSQHDSIDKEGNNYSCGTKKNWADPSELTKENLFSVGCECVLSGEILSKQNFGKLFSGVGYLSAVQKHYGTFSDYKKKVYEHLGMSVHNPLSGSKGNSDATRIVAIKLVDEAEDVYDITVDDNHNFFANGYLVHNCNLVITFKIRHDALNMTVFNRSNDTHWGVFGANLCQFSTIQETLLNWLRKSGNPELSSLKMGTYNQITDSLHIYMDSYGSKCTDDVMDYYKENPEEELEVDFLLDSDKGNFEPRMRLSAEEFDAFISVFWSVINPYLMDDETLVDDERCEEVFGKVGLVDGMYRRGVIDDYWLMVIQAMLSYRLVKMGMLSKALNYMSVMADCQWKVSMMFFLKTFIYKQEGDMKEEYYNKFNEIMGNMKLSYSSAFGEDSKEVKMLMKYLAL